MFAVLQMAVGAAQGLQYMHDKNVLHKAFSTS